MSLAHIHALVAEDMKQVDQVILAQLHSDIPLIAQIGQHIISSGGKRLRPLLVLLASKAFQYSGDQHAHLAAVVEFIHTATLLHDDVVDSSTLRRGKKTANAIWGNEASVLVGDFVYSRSFQMMVSLDNLPIMKILADATNKIAEGEVLQLLNRHDPSTTEERYLAVIRYKTAILFEAATRLGALIAGCSVENIDKLAAYGLHLGLAFQLIDDALDYNSSAEQLGKNIGDDLAEGKPTLPLIYAMRVGTTQQRSLIENAIREGGIADLNGIQQAIESTNAIAYTYQAARHQANQAITALSSIPASNYRDALTALAEFAVSRKF